MAIRGPRLEFAVGAFLLLALASLLVLAVASSPPRFGRGRGGYLPQARFFHFRQLCPHGPVNVGALAVRQVPGLPGGPVK